MGGINLYGQKLRDLRKIEGWTQEEVAKKLGISKQTYSHYENENRKPGLETIKKLAQVYQVDIDKIFSDADMNGLTSKEEKDIATKLENMMAELESDTSLAFMGEPMDEEDRQLLKISLENALRTSRQMAKNKFTPKKHR
jgi:transcriptional regulator with XRE-family HTH domain